MKFNSTFGLAFVFLLALSLFSLSSYATLTSPTTTGEGVALNNTVLNRDWMLFNYTFSDSKFSNCTLDFHNGTAAANYTMSNDTASCWINLTTMGETAYNQKWNWTVYLRNSTDVITNTSGQYFIEVDTTNPIITHIAHRYQNDSHKTYMNVSFTVADNHTSRVYLRIYWSDNTNTTVDVTNYNISSGTQSINYEYNVTTADMDGGVVLEYWANDTAQNTTGDYVVNSAYGTNTSSILVSYLRPSAWNLVSWTGNTTGWYNTSDIILGGSDMPHGFPGVTSISIFDNAYFSKNFTTYSTATKSINNNSYVWFGKNATYLYNGGSSGYYWFRNSTVPTSSSTNETLQTGYYNDSGVTNRTSWNLYIPLSRITANSTMYTNDTQHTTYPGNITAVAFFNSSSNAWISCALGWSYCTGTSNEVDEVYIPESSAIWVLVTDNITYYNRSVIY